MKSLLKKIAGLLSVSILIFSIAGCPQDVHVHTFAEGWTSNDTDHWHAATCGDTDEVSGKAAHTFGEYVSNNDATTEADGTKTRTCSVCGYEDKVTDEGTIIHTFAEGWTSNATDHWHEATCGDTDEVSGKAAHTFGDWNEVTAATEETVGSREKVCSVCSYKVTEPVPVLPHTHALGTKHDAVNGTCTTKGTVEYYDCIKSSCTAKLDASRNELASIEGTLNPENHVGTVYWERTRTTHKGTCNSCGAVKTAEEAHSFGAYETGSNGGTAGRTCTACRYWQSMPDEFVLVDGKNIEGTEIWTPSSKVFVSGRAIEIPTLIVCDHEVTRGEFKAIMGTDPSTADAYSSNGYKLTGDGVLNNPVNYVNWYDAIAYCNKLSIKENLTPCYTVEGVTDWESLEYNAIPTDSDTAWDAVTCNFEANGYRLPTEAEWEWLARGGEDYDYAGSNTLDEVGWYWDNTVSKKEGKTGTRPVKTKKRNGYGLYDMSGNVCEWCWDWYAPIESTTAAAGNDYGTYRAWRGGSWGTGKGFACVSDLRSRSNDEPDFRDNAYGFRVVRNNN